MDKRNSIKKNLTKKIKSVKSRLTLDYKVYFEKRIIAIT